MIKIGEKYKQWTVLKVTDKRYKSGQILYECQCKCGKIQLLSKAHLLFKNRNFSCKSCTFKDKAIIKFNNYIGKIIGKWKLIGPIIIKMKKNSKKETFIKCICECGTENEIRIHELKRGATLSCKDCGIKCADCGCYGHGLSIITSKECELFGFCKRCDKFCCMTCSSDPTYHELNA